MRKRRLAEWTQQVVFTGPAVILFAVIVLLPFALGFYYSMTQWNGVSKDIVWIGLDNYKAILWQDADFARSFWFTTKITVAIVVLTNLFGFAIAYMLTQRLKLRNILRTSFFIPNVLGGLLLGFIWQFIFVNGFSAIGRLTDLALFKLPWLGTASTAFWGLVLVSVWQGAGYVMVIYIAGLSGVPKELKEASLIDGANGWQVIRRIILPLIVPAITVCLFWTINSTYKMYDLNYSLTDGGPYGSSESVAMNIFNTAFVNNRFGMGTAKSVILFVTIALITTLQVYLSKKKEVEM